MNSLIRKHIRLGQQQIEGISGDIRRLKPLVTGNITPRISEEEGVRVGD